MTLSILQFSFCLFCFYWLEFCKIFVEHASKTFSYIFLCLLWSDLMLTGFCNFCSKTKLNFSSFFMLKMDHNSHLLTNDFFRYALHWEPKNLIAVSTAIQDWLTSSNWFAPDGSTLFFKLVFLSNVMITVLSAVDIGDPCCRNCNGVYEARCNADRVKHTFGSIGLASNITCRNWFYRQQMDNCYWQVSFPSLTIGEILRWKWEKNAFPLHQLSLSQIWHLKLKSSGEIGN